MWSGIVSPARSPCRRSPHVTWEPVMDGTTARKNLEQRQARILEASGYPGPVAAGLIGAAEKTRIVAEAAEQRRLLRDAGLLATPNRSGWLARASSATRQLVARVAAGWPKRSSSKPTASPSA
jgi:hypothetical protein